MRLIDADKTIGILKTRLYETALNNATVNCDASYLYTECADNRIEVWIDEMPTVDAEPIKRGCWVGIGDYPYDEWECDCCGATWSSGYLRELRYCPNCGAKMEKVTE